MPARIKVGPVTFVATLNSNKSGVDVNENLFKMAILNFVYNLLNRALPKIRRTVQHYSPSHIPHS